MLVIATSKVAYPNFNIYFVLVAGNKSYWFVTGVKWSLGLVVGHWASVWSTGLVKMFILDSI